MDTKTENKKVFLKIVKHLRELIKSEGIQPGDKLPSERVLSERLNVGRSSVREALRSLELLGLIETRHGGGTFLAVVQSHQLVEILASFILQENKSIEDVHTTRRMHEKEAIRVICSDRSLRNLPVWESLFMKLEVDNDVIRNDILKELIIASGNRLALKIWLQLAAYSTKPLKQPTTVDEKLKLQMLLKSLQLGYEKEALEAYEDWMNYLRNSIL
ncbi:GntR family transcriptional regulator [Lysinibacillus telephonicus]|uniref:FadR family transcriptional regulator n=1 Tax=Lysinibacillus telephonicus TaxID=1714840 RepID=A0A3S0QV60_9BACI|nr:GntR family transcriptional regulator [Lysinibacillus telephonicus]RTQ92549.1 FadR family transcriptional regulator [Lysinibacillus telephonicus]